MITFNCKYITTRTSRYEYNILGYVKSYRYRSRYSDNVGNDRRATPLSLHICHFVLKSSLIATTTTSTTTLVRTYEYDESTASMDNTHQCADNGIHGDGTKDGSKQQQQQLYAYSEYGNTAATTIQSNGG